MLKIVILTHGLEYGGAQVSTIELLKLLLNVVDIKIIMSENANQRFIKEIKSLKVAVHFVPCSREFGYPIMKISKVENLIRSSNVLWISDEVYLTASAVKMIEDIPIIAHIRSYALICPRWSACYGLSKLCLKPCNLLRFITCKLLLNNLRQKLGEISCRKAQINSLLSIAKAPIDYFNWSFRSKYVIDSIDGFIAVSKAVWDIHVLHRPLLKGKPFTIIYNPIGVPNNLVDKSLKKKEKRNPPILLFASVFASIHKGPHILLEALKILEKMNFTFKTYMVGCKGTWIENYAKKLHVDKNIVFLELLAREKLYELMASSDLVIIPSIWPEPMGRIAIEANYLGVPVVASRTGGLTEVVEDGVTGILVEPGSSVALARGIVKALSMNIQRKTIHNYTAMKFKSYLIRDKLLNFFTSLA